MTARAQIRIVLVRDLQDLHEGQTFELKAARFVIGRAPSNDLCLPDPRVSRQHTEFVWEGERYHVQDCGSINGTFVNGERLPSGSRRMLKDGDEIAVSPLLALRFQDPGATVEEVMPPQVMRGLSLDAEKQAVYINLRRLDPPLAPQGFRLLETLYSRNGAVVALEELIDLLWPEAVAEGVTPAMLDNQVARLRQRLQQVDPDHDYIERIRNKGLRFVQKR